MRFWHYMQKYWFLSFLYKNQVYTILSALTLSVDVSMLLESYKICTYITAILIWQENMHSIRSISLAHTGDGENGVRRRWLRKTFLAGEWLSRRIRRGASLKTIIGLFPHVTSPRWAPRRIYVRAFLNDRPRRVVAVRGCDVASRATRRVKIGKSNIGWIMTGVTKSVGTYNARLREGGRSRIYRGVRGRKIYACERKGEGETEQSSAIQETK